MLRMYASNSHIYTHLILALGIVESIQYDIGLPNHDVGRGNQPRRENQIDNEINIITSPPKMAGMGASL